MRPVHCLSPYLQTGRVDWQDRSHMQGGDVQHGSCALSRKHGVVTAMIHCRLTSRASCCWRSPQPAREPPCSAASPLWEWGWTRTPSTRTYCMASPSHACQSLPGATHCLHPRTPHTWSPSCHHLQSHDLPLSTLEAERITSASTSFLCLSVSARHHSLSSSRKPSYLITSRLLLVIKLLTRVPCRQTSLHTRSRLTNLSHVHCHKVGWTIVEARAFKGQSSMRGLHVHSRCDSAFLGIILQIQITISPFFITSHVYLVPEESLCIGKTSSPSFKRGFYMFIAKRQHLHGGAHGDANSPE